MAEAKVGPWVRASGIALGFLVLVQLGVGLYLNGVYAATPDGATEAMATLRKGGLPGFLQHVHYWASAWLIVHGFLHVAFLIWSGAYARISRWAWLASVGLLGTAHAMQVTGNLLPFDRHDVQTAVKEGSVAAGLPLLGNFFSTLLLNGESFGPKTLSAWHTFHLALIAPLVVCGLACLFAFPAREKSKGLARFFWLMPLAGVALLALVVPSPFGAPSTSADYALADARPSWYVWPLHGSVNAFEALSGGLGWIGAVVLPGLFGALLIFAPALGTKRDGLVRGLFSAFVLGFGVLGVLYGGTPAPAWGRQDVADVIADPSKAAPIDERLAQYGFRMALQNCALCHGKDLKGGSGKPDLTTQFQRHADADFFIRFMKNPSKTKPGSLMPGQSHLPEEEIVAMAEWLRKPKP